MSAADKKVIADRDYQPGEAIVTPDLPIVHVLDQEYKYIYCDECFLKSPTLKRCGGCRKMAYCSRACQVTNWKGGHKWECPIFQTAAASSRGLTVDFFGEDSDFERYILRAWLLLRNPPNKLHTTEVTLPAGEKRRFADLLSNADLFKRNKQFMKDFREDLFPVFMRYKLLDPVDKNRENLFNLRCTMRINSFGVDPLFGDHEEEIGAALYLTASAFNHSCRPNAAQLWPCGGIKMKIIALLPIRRGEEICIRYTDRIKTTAYRRERLERIYCFTCQCERCSTTSASEELTRQEAAALRAITSHAQDVLSLQLQKMFSDQDGIIFWDTEDEDLQILRHRIAHYELLQEFWPTAEPKMIRAMLQISQSIIRIARQRFLTSPRTLGPLLGRDVQQSQWTDDEWLTQTERHLAMIVGRDHPEYVEFKSSLHLYGVGKMCQRIASAVTMTDL